MSKTFLTRTVFAAIVAMPAASFTVPAQAETLFNFLLGGNKPRVERRTVQQARIPNTRYRSDKSPIRRQIVSFPGKYGAGTIVIDTSDRRLYLTQGDGTALAYGIGVGREGFTWTGTKRISRKAEWPGWTPPKRMIERVRREEGRILPAYMPGGPENPLGARAMYLGSSLFRIHGTNQPWTIGRAVSSGCIRMANDDVIHLYNQVGVGTKVIVRG
jgi:lipoprotein-anchoring transpeptidase ErfK/SrfK